MKKIIRGRYEYAPYITEIKNKFEEDFPDSVPKEWLIDKIIKYFWEGVEASLENEGKTDIYAYGRFFCVNKISKHGVSQWYPKFKFSRHFYLRLREKKGTLSESETIDVQKKKQFMKNVWDYRKDHTLKHRGKLPSQLENNPE